MKRTDSNPPANSSKSPPERPLECSECRKPVKIWYTEILQSVTTQTGMCADCPQLNKHLYRGEVSSEQSGYSISGANIVCGNCDTALTQVTMGAQLGCIQCYEVFAQSLVDELKKADRIILPAEGQTYHVGRGTGEQTQLSPRLRLLALNEALNETLSNENYEQAAWLRDQIKAIEGDEESEEPPIAGKGK
ncbi:MAG: UvrB/UvrC motif-containing protein [Chlamydiia bacterium]|nr:UvrB/UvrC motif-containing protein [Chlamydiia bacterium]